jgi:hypothetical protein
MILSKFLLVIVKILTEKLPRNYPQIYPTTTAAEIAAFYDINLNGTNAYTKNKMTTKQPYSSQNMKSHNVAQARRGRFLALPILTVIASALFCFSTHRARAQVINFDVPGGAGGTNYSGQGAYAHSGNNFWNAIVPNGTATSC